MPYSHFHNWSFHTHHRRPKGGNHYNAIRRRQRPWRIGFTMMFVVGLVGLAIVGVFQFDDQRRSASTFAVEFVEEQSQRQEYRAQTRAVSQPTTKQTREASAEQKQEQHERAIVSLINQERSQRGIREMAWDPKLQAIARGHSRDMAEKGYFDHTNRSGQDYRQRAVLAGYRCQNPKWRGVAENLYFGSRGHQSPQAAVSNWLSSPLHKRAMLDATFSKAAIGIHEGYLSGYGQGFFTTLLLC